MISLQGVQDECFIRLRDLKVAESTAVGEVQLGDSRLHAQAGELRVHLDVYALIGLHTNNKFITRDILEDTACNILELYANLSLLLIEGCRDLVSLVVSIIVV